MNTWQDVEVDNEYWDWKTGGYYAVIRNQKRMKIMIPIFEIVGPETKKVTDEAIKDYIEKNLKEKLN